MTRHDRRPALIVRREQCSKGISLLEVLLCVVMLGSCLMPIAVLIQSSGTSNRAFDSQSIKMQAINSILRNVDGERLDFYTAYNKTTMQTTVVNGVTVPYITKVDDSNSNALTHRLYVYLYKNSTDSISSPTYSYTRDYLLDELRIDVGYVGLVDSSNQLWIADGQYDPTTSKSHAGWYTAGSGAAVVANTFTNVSTTNNAIYESYRSAGSTIGNSFEYRFDVDNGNYIVQLYFAELSGSSTRTLDVSVEGTVPSTPNMTNFNAYAAANNTNLRAVVRSIPVTVYDGVLNVVVSTKTTGQGARLQGIVLRRAI